ncbi:MAG: tyrosine-type recombinase/integrase [Candidatus Faecousia sp.]|nr:tyrosine-type recombinase/integrase [Bacillota bacterium]MDY6040995.1 tyrosine-type recombinase/integrase [Candidatus Faecousia sp.]
MATNSTGVYQKDNGYWEYRFVMMVDGKQINKKKSTDAFGNKLKTKREAIKAREAAMLAARTVREEKPKTTRRTVKDVYEEYCEKGRKDRAYQTIRKQDSIWENHLFAKFGNRYVDEISVAEVTDYLSELYYIHNFSYQYTESFLKMFYLIFGQAYSRNYLEVDDYNRLCVNKDTRIRMPKMKSEDDTDIVAFSHEQLALLDEYFKGTNAETAYLLGRYCGLRINECFGLKWENVDLENGTITIDRQMQYQESLIKLVAPKTRNSKRVVYMSHALKVHLQEKAQQRAEDEVRFAALREQNRRLIEDVDGSKFYSTELVNCLPNGKVQTVNSMKYPSREIKKKLGIQFKFHYLRHTYGTLMAEMNTPTHLLCNQMGHGNIHVTQKYYIAVSKSG